MTNRTLPRYGKLIAALLLTASAAAQAATTGYAKQQAEQPPSSPESYAQPTASAANFADTDLQSYIKVQQEVEAIRTEMAAKLQNMQDPQEAQKAQEDANKRMLGAVEKAGLTREKYNEIARAVMSNPALAEKVKSFQ
jgi:hypothetical protein